MAETANRKFCDLFNHRKMLMGLIWITYFVFLFIVVCFAIRTFFPKKTRIPKSINVSIVDTKEHGKELSPKGKANVKEQLHTALLEVSGNAEAAYNEKFATLLTILTLFGVAWPLVITYLQNLSLKEDRAKISEANKKAEDIYQKNKHQEKELIKTKAFLFIQIGGIYMYFAEISGLMINKRSYSLDNGKEIKIPLIEDKKKVELGFKTLIDSLENFLSAEKTDPSHYNAEKTSLGYIEMVSTAIFNLTYNYENIDYISVISILDKAISETEQLDTKLSVVKNALQNLYDSKKLLEQYHLTQLDKRNLS